jgi:hypothetical protein
MVATRRGTQWTGATVRPWGAPDGLPARRFSYSCQVITNACVVTESASRPLVDFGELNDNLIN